MAFKTWQILAFSLIPLALIFAGVIGGSFHGSDSNAEVFQTPAPPATTPTVAPSPTAPRGGMFSPRSPMARPETQATVRLNEQDLGVPHDPSVYRTNQPASANPSSQAS